MQEVMSSQGSAKVGAVNLKPLPPREPWVWLGFLRSKNHFSSLAATLNPKP